MKKTALYVRTVETTDTHEDDDEWRLPTTIDADTEIEKLYRYARECGYSNLEVYLDKRRRHENLSWRLLD